MIKFSIITVCYNAEKNIRETVESVLGQTYPEIEFIIIDGQSTDNTLSILKEYASDHRLTIFSEADSGIYNAMNKGIARAKGNYLYFLNAGDIFYNQNVINDIFVYIGKSNADIIAGNYIEKRHELSKLIQLKAETNWKEVCEKGGGICHQAIFANISCLKNGFDENYKIAADYDWLCKQINNGYKVECVDIIVSEFDIYGVSSLARNWLYTKEECRQIVERNFPYKKDDIRHEIEIQYKNTKNQKTIEYLSDILALKQKNKSLKKYFVDNVINEIAIYGFQYLGQSIFRELENSEIKVKYIIDRDHSFQNMKVPVKFIDDVLEHVDAIVVTPIFEFYTIKQILEKKVCCLIVSIEDIINSMY